MICLILKVKNSQIATVCYLIFYTILGPEDDCDSNDDCESTKTCIASGEFGRRECVEGIAVYNYMKI